MDWTREKRDADEIMETATAFQRARVLLTAHELGLFAILGRKTLAADEIAGLAGTDPRATHRLLCALCATGLMRREGDAFRNTEVGRRHLDPGGEAPLAALGHLSHLYHGWGTLTEAVRSGCCAAPPWRDEKRLRSFMRIMHSRGRREAALILPLLGLDGVTRALDVGGGSGAFALAMAEASPEVRTTLIDLPQTIEITKEVIEGHPEQERIELRPGDMREADFGSGFDLVLFMQILHQFAPRTNRDLLARAAAALRPGGRVAVQDFIMDEDRTAPPVAALFALNMLVGTEFGDTYTETEIAAWMREAGLTDVTRFATSPNHAMLVGTKS